MVALPVPNGHGAIGPYLRRRARRWSGRRRRRRRWTRRRWTAPEMDVPEMDERRGRLGAGGRRGTWRRAALVGGPGPGDHDGAVVLATTSAEVGRRH